MRPVILVWLLGTAACVPVATTANSQAKDLQLYETMTPSPLSAPPTNSIKLPESPLPSPTPFTYTIKAGDTLGGIADKFNVELDTLLAANPEVNPNAMSIGETLKIPSNPRSVPGESTPTPAPFSVQQIACHPTADHGLWCFVLARNDSTNLMEDVMARVTLLNIKGEPVGSQTALLPLDILPPDQALPLSVAFAPDVPSDVVPQVQVLTAISLAPKDPRYLDATVQNTLVRVDWSGRSAQVSGQVGLPADSRPASQIWVAAVAYDRSGSVIGVRRWEWSGGMQPGTLLPFSFTVSSIAGEIERVEFAVEARP